MNHHYSPNPNKSTYTARNDTENCIFYCTEKMRYQKASRDVFEGGIYRACTLEV